MMTKMIKDIMNRNRYNPPIYLNRQTGDIGIGRLTKDEQAVMGVVPLTNKNLMKWKQKE